MKALNPAKPLAEDEANANANANAKTIDWARVIQILIRILTIGLIHLKKHKK